MKLPSQLRTPKRLLARPVIMLAALCAVATVRADVFKDDFNRVDAEGKAIGDDWDARGPMHLVEKTVELMPDVSSGFGTIELVEKALDTTHEKNKKFEESVDFLLSAPESEGRAALLFDFADGRNFSVFCCGQGKLWALAIRDGEIKERKDITIDAKLVPNKWYRLKVTSSGTATLECSLAKADSPSVVITKLTFDCPPDSPVGTGGVQASSIAQRFDNFSLVTSK